MNDKDMISREVERHGYSVREWRDGEDGLEGVVGHFRVDREDEDAGLCDGDEGSLVASIVGAEQYGNRRVHFGLNVKDYDSSYDVSDLDAVEPVDG